MKKLIKNIPIKIYRWCTETRLRKILSSTLAILIVITSIRYLFLRPKEVKAADVYLSFDEGYGTSNSIHDANGNISAGSITDAVWKPEDLCKTGKCLYFDGDTSQVTFNDDADLDFAAADDFTIEGWFRHPEISTASQYLLTKYQTSAAGGYAVYMDSDGDIVFGVDDDGTWDTANLIGNDQSKNYDDNKWHYFVAQKDGTTGIYLYVDGILIDQDTDLTGDTGTLANGGSLYIGSDDVDTRIWKGFIDEIKIYRSLRTVAELNADYLGETQSRGTSASFGPNNSYLSNGLVGYWKMDETATPAVDYSGNGGSGTWGGNTSSASGKFGNSVSLDGTGDYLQVSNNSALQITQNITLSAWVYSTDQQSDYGHIIVKNAQDTWTGVFGYYRLMMEGDEKIRFEIANDSEPLDCCGDEQTLTSTNSVSTNAWHHVVGTYDGEYLRVYIDGQMDSSKQLVGFVMGSSTHPLHIGINDDTSDEDFDGRIDEARIYNRALSPAEISNLYSWAPGPVAHWKLDENTSTTANDSSTNNLPIAFPTPASGGGAIEVDGTASTGKAATSPITVSHTTGSGSNRLMLVGISAVSNGGAITVSDVTYGGVSLGAAVGTALFSTYQRISIYKMVAPASGTANVEVTFSAAPENGAIVGVMTYTGVDQTTPLGTFAGATGTGATSTVNVSSATDELVFDTVNAWDSLTVGGGQSSLWNTGQTNTFAGGSTEAGAASVTMSWTNSGGSTWAIGAVPIKPALVAATNPVPVWTQGKFGSGLSFDGIDDYLTLSDNAAFDFADDQDMTLETWFKHSTASAQEIILSKYNEAGYKIIMESDGDITCGLDYDSTWSPTDFATSTAANYDDGNWHHIACVKSGASSLSLYIDGVLITTDPSLTATNTLTNSDPIYFGIDADGTSNNFTGMLDDIKIYNYARNPGQVVEDMNAGHPAPGSPVGSALGYWKFDEGYGDTANDSGTANIDGNLSGSTTCPSTSICPTWDNDGKFGKALYFGGLQTADGDSHVRLTNDAYDAQTEGSISLWFKPDDSGDTQQVLFGAAEDDDIGGSDVVDIGVDINNNSFVIGGVDNGSIVLNAATPAISNYTNWHHAVWNMSASGNEVYIDGVKQNMTYTTGSATTNIWFDNVSENTTAYTMGCVDADASNNNDCIDAYLYQGYLDEFKIYSFPLTAEQVKVEYNKGSQALLGATSTDSSGNPTWSAENEYCPPGQGSTCTPPIGYWKMDENSGTTNTNDSSTGGNTGTMNGFSLDNWAPGKVGRSLDFNGSSNYVDTTDTPFDITGDFTLEAWVDSDTVGPGNQFIVTKRSGAGGGGGYDIAIGSSAEIYCQTDNGTTTASSWTATGAISASAGWQHVVAARSGSTCRIYVNGLDKTTNFGTHTTLATNNNVFRIGANLDNSEYWNGKIDEVKVYNYARSQAQIAWDYNRGAPIAYWKMDEASWNGTANEVKDSSGNGYHGVRSGNATTTTTGKVNSAGTFDNNGDNVTVTHNSSLSIGGSFSLSTWFYANSFPGASSFDTMLTKDGGNNGNYYIELTETDEMDCGFYASGAYHDHVTTTANMSTATWYHAACVFDDTNNTIKIYLNGKEIYSNSESNSPTTNTADIKIGSTVAGTNYVDGKLDDMRIYNYPLNAQQVELLYNAGNAVRFAPVTGTP